MPTIREVKTELRHREWAEQIQECQSSGMTVTAWCKEKGISQHTYYSRLNVVRKELLMNTAKKYLTTPTFICYNNMYSKCRCDGIGRRVGLKIRWQRYRTGSTPVTGTKFPWACSSVGRALRSQRRGRGLLIKRHGGGSNKLTEKFNICWNSSVGRAAHS